MFAIVPIDVISRAGSPSPANYPDHNRLLLFSDLGLGPNIQRQAILAKFITLLFQEWDERVLSHEREIGLCVFRVGHWTEVAADGAGCSLQSQSTSANQEAVVDFGLTNLVALILPLPENFRGGAKRREPIGGWA